VSLLILAGIYLFSRIILVRVVKAWAVKDKNSHNSWLLLAKKLPTLLLILGILFIWGQELRDLALSLVAVAAALVLATKEVILCFMGGLLKASTKLFEIGDRISVAGYRGKVVEQSLLTTTLQEIGPGVKSNQSTGRFLKMPNSLFLSNTITVVPSSYDYVIHVISIMMPLSPKWDVMESLLMESAQEVFSEYRANFEKFAQKHKNLTKSHSLGQEPRVVFEVNSKDTIEFQVKMTVPYEALSRTENRVARAFMQKVTSENIFEKAES
jgi:small-conductance mechanosensitive channel